MTPVKMYLTRIDAWDCALHLTPVFTEFKVKYLERGRRVTTLLGSLIQITEFNDSVKSSYLDESILRHQYSLAIPKFADWVYQ